MKLIFLYIPICFYVCALKAEPLDLGARTYDGRELRLLWGTGSRFALGEHRTTFNGVVDHTAQIGYNPHTSNVMDCSAFLQFESAFKNGAAYDTEFHFNFRPPGTQNHYRWLQVNSSWGAPYSTDGKAAGENWVAFGASRFTISGDHTDTFGARLAFEAKFGEPDFLLQPTSNYADARLRIARVGRYEWLQLGAAGAGTQLGGANNLLTIDTVGPNLPQTRSIAFRRSFDGGLSYSPMLQVVAHTNKPRWLFNGVVDDGQSAVQIDGNIKVEGTLSTAGSTAPQWKLGSLVTGTITASTTEYVEIEINGRKVKLVVAQ